MFVTPNNMRLQHRKLDVCNSETSKSTFATSRLIHMQHVSEIVTTSQHLDLLLQHSHETLANILQKHPKHMQHTLATTPKLCLLATMTAARSSSSWPRGAAPRVAGELRAWPREGKPWHRRAPCGGCRAQPCALWPRGAAVRAAGGSRS
jgi:hypothetical protein